MTRTTLCPIFAFTALACLTAAYASESARVLDQDTADRPPYADGWQHEDDGSTAKDGLGGWVFGDHAKTKGHATTASSKTNGGGDIDTRGKSFTLTDATDSGQYIDVFRFIDPDDLQPGQTLRFGIDVNFRKGFKGVRVRGADDKAAIFRFEVGNPGEGDDYTVYDAATGNGSIGSDYHADTRFLVELTQTDAEGGTWRVTRSGGMEDEDQGTYRGVVSSLQFYTYQAGSESEQAIHFNRFQIVTAR